MRKLFFAVLALLACAIPVFSHAAETVSGTVSFLTRRGQRPNVNETVVWLEPVGATKVTKPAAQVAQMVTRSKALQPHVIAIPAGSTIQFPNDDPISHNLFSLSSGNVFDLGLYRKGAGKSKKFDRPGVVNVYCNVHPNMSAVVHVLETPYISYIDSTGAFAIKDVWPGKYRLIAWNELGTTQSEIEVPAAGAFKGSSALTIDSRGFRSQSHMNKFGKPYSKPSSKDY